MITYNPTEGYHSKTTNLYIISQGSINSRTSKKKSKQDSKRWNLIAGELIDGLAPEKPELTCISEEGIADMDLPDNMLEDLDYIGDCITSCNKVENYLMLSEFENNLIAEMPIITDRRGRRWSLARPKGGQSNLDRSPGPQSTNEETDPKPKWHLTNVPPANRVITVIDEAST